MAIVAPFKGTTYDFRLLGDVAALMAPPYDVISEEEQETYYQASPYNIIRLILGKKKKGDSDWDNRYSRSADCFRRWENDDILIRSSNPSMYITALDYDPADGSGPKTRVGMILLAKIEDEESGVILPHERTFSAHRDDRLKLMRACDAQFSQIFGLYDDPERRINDTVEEFMGRSPQIAFSFRDGNGHRMWTVRDEAFFRSVSAVLQDKSIFIADGHHRYETARNYRNIMRARYGKRPPHRSYEYVMMYLSNMADQGLTILPAHRLITRCEDFRINDFLDGIRQRFDIEERPIPDHSKSHLDQEIKNALEERGHGTTAVGFYHHGGKKYYLFTLKPGARDEMGEDLHVSQKQLDVLVLSRFILQQTLGFTLQDLDKEDIFHYNSNTKDALLSVMEGNHELAFFLNPTKIEHVKDVAGHGHIMPRKSTYFYPKVLTGMVLNKIDPYEIIQIPGDARP